MKIYLVGGAVRDRLLGRNVTERDWVVVGATPEEMVAQGYKPIGKDFPVFLHPQTHEEYALARTERKTAAGYHGFNVYAAPDVTLEQDLLRRDLTINAIAEDENGTLFDPYGGHRDIASRQLRHVSPAFAEDPVRLLRVARFAARYAPLGFGIAPETQAMLRDLVASGEVDHLVPERVWAELHKVLGEDEPWHFVTVLRYCGALARLMPEIDRLFGVPQPPKYHPEIDTGVHTLMALMQAVRMTSDKQVRFATLLHDLGKGLTPKEILPSHWDHEQRGADAVKEFCSRLRVPNEFRDLAIMNALRHTECHRSLEMRTTNVLRLLERCDAFRKPQRFEQFLIACEADARGRTGWEDRNYPQANYLRAVLTAAAKIDIAAIVAGGKTGPALAEAIRRERVRAIARDADPQFKAKTEIDDAELDQSTD